MALVRTLRTGSVALLVLPLLVVGCAGLNAYRPDAEITQSRYTTIVNYSTAPVDPDRVDTLLTEVAEILAVQLNPAVASPRIVVTTPDQIARLYDRDAPRFPSNLQARALYFPGAQVILIPYFDRSLLGRQFAHYLTEHYLTAPRSEWYQIARAVEWQLAFGTRGAAGRRAATLADAPAAPRTSETGAPPPEPGRSSNLQRP